MYGEYYFSNNSWILFLVSKVYINKRNNRLNKNDQKNNGSSPLSTEGANQTNKIDQTYNTNQTITKLSS